MEIKGAYWFGMGPEQAKYDEMHAAGFKFNSTTEKVMHAYYRFYNDGDATPHIAALMRNCKDLSYVKDPEYVAYTERWEDRVTERIKIEYRRFQRERKA